MSLTARASKRLAKLDQVFSSRGCHLCRGWSAIVLCDENDQSARPERCPDCGRVVPIRTRVCIVGIPLETI